MIRFFKRFAAVCFLTASATSAFAHPTFRCRPSNLAVEKAICSDPDLTRLDGEIDDAYKAALARTSRKDVAPLQKEQRDFIVERSRSFGNPDDQLKRALEARLTQLRRIADGK